MGKIVNPSEEASRKQAIATGHSFVYVDEILQTKTDGYQIQVTLGWSTPAGTYAPVATVCMPAPFADILVDALTKAKEEASQKRTSSERSGVP